MKFDQIEIDCTYYVYGGTAVQVLEKIERKKLVRVLYLENVKRKYGRRKYSVKILRPHTLWIEQKCKKCKRVYCECQEVSKWN